MVACDADEDALGGTQAKGLIGKLTTILEDCGITAKRRDATDIGLPIEEELEDRLKLAD